MVGSTTKFLRKSVVTILSFVSRASGGGSGVGTRVTDLVCEICVALGVGVLKRDKL